MLGASKKMYAGILTFKSTDGYVLTAPVDLFETSVEASYDDVYIDSLLDSAAIYRDSQSVEFKARLQYGESYTIRDLGVDAVKTLAVKGDKVDITQTYRSALGVPTGATARYRPKKDETIFTWSERVVVEDEGGRPF